MNAQGVPGVSGGACTPLFYHKVLGSVTFEGWNGLTVLAVVVEDICLEGIDPLWAAYLGAVDSTTPQDKAQQMVAEWGVKLQAGVAHALFPDLDMSKHRKR